MAAFILVSCCGDLRALSTCASLPQSLAAPCFFIVFIFIVFLTYQQSTPSTARTAHMFSPAAHPAPRACLHLQGRHCLCSNDYLRALLSVRTYSLRAPTPCAHLLPARTHNLRALITFVEWNHYLSASTSNAATASASPMVNTWSGTPRPKVCHTGRSPNSGTCS